MTQPSRPWPYRRPKEGTTVTALAARLKLPCGATSALCRRAGVELVQKPPRLATPRPSRQKRPRWQPLSADEVARVLARWSEERPTRKDGTSGLGSDPK